MPTPLQPEQIRTLTEQAHRHLRAGKPREAVRLLTPIAERAGAASSTLLVYARALTMLGQNAMSVRAYDRFAELESDHPPAFTERAIVLSRMGRFNEAIRSVRHARQSRRWYGPAVFEEADLLIELRRPQEAFEVLREFERSAPKSEHTLTNAARLSVIRARLVPAFVEPESALGDMLGFANDDRVPVALRCVLQARAAGILDSLGRVKESFAAHDASKRLRNQPWDAGEHKHRTETAIRAWSSDEVKNAPKSDIDGSGFLFIAGMPRSGSSLLEQMLSRHPEIQALGERNEMIRAASYLEPHKPGQLPMVTDPARLTGERVREIAQHNYEAIRAIREPGAKYVTDKQPLNFAHLPLMARLMPGSKVIHTVRDPRDTCLSYYTQWFLSPHGQTNTWGDLGLFYRDYRTMMDAWERLAAPSQRPEMLTVVYEELVREPERVLRAVTDFLGLAFDDAMLEHTASDRVVNTASRDQVCKELYTSSIGRWKKYAEVLGPLLEHIEPYCND